MAARILPEGTHVFERGWLSSNNILFTGGDKTLLVDSGYCTHAEQTLSLVEAVLGSCSLDALVNTHLHSDHCGGNAALQARYPALQTWIPPGHARQVAQWDAVALTYVPTGQLCPRFNFDQTLQPGTEIRFGKADWQIHAAPGHDPHSVVFFEPVTRVLISADALWENGFGVVFPELEGESAFSEVAATLALIGRLNPKTIIPGHGRIFSYTPQTLSKAYQRLDAFTASPLRHARHGVKVLLKFKLLEVQRQSTIEFTKWATVTPHFQQIRERFFADIPMHRWIEQLCNELATAGVAGQEGEYIVNL
ncbi:MBL fold metallo-hydrolase [Polaromonas sp. CG_9.11]|uniref:MBL fold metallo-hydrolase n=1 Tax=Polaromonas sp. CG_9.11 TaxID=2787730 RepID=UPI0018C90FFE|nr:MBL fold metallo-hydrolase [Polaromonas sp. CG_9.11]MBG6075715.1 glyoxylase-like metal-dependent hydrolase (beta-lactamase superfamily II) [Polaromonas sp. CG_9.11]